MKKLLSALALTAAMAFTSTTAFADSLFYSQNVGQWSVEGLVTENGISLCNATTYWDDGSYVGVVAEKGLDFVYLEVYNTEWYITDPIGTNTKLYVGAFKFVDRYGRETSGSIDYELAATNLVRFTHLTEQFFLDWAQYREMYIIMPGDIQSIQLGLDGTTQALTYLAECVDRL